MTLETNEAGNSVNGIPSGGVSGPQATSTGDSLPSGPMPKGPGAPNPNGQGGSAKAPPPSKFDQGNEVPQITVEPVKHPDDHKHDKKCAAVGDHVITAEYCLEQFARVMMEVAEAQEDPVWVESHRTLAEQWMQMAQILLQYRIDAQANQGEAELKQQQLNQQDELHKQTLAQNDQVHTQGMQHTDQMHKQGMAQKDQQHKMGLDQQTDQHKLKMDSANKSTKMKLDLQAQQSKQSLQAKAAASKSAGTTRKP